MSSATQLRVATAAILIPGVAVAIWWGPTWLVAGLAALVAVFALLEFFALGGDICAAMARGPGSNLFETR